MIYNSPAGFTRGSSNIVELVKKDGKGNRNLGRRIITVIYKLDGIKGFFRGIFASLLLYVPFSMLFWSTYYFYLYNVKSFVNWYTIKEGNRAEKDKCFTTSQCISAGLAGATAALLTNPLEMYRLRVQVQRMGYKRTAEEMWKVEGPRCLWKGLTPRLLSKAISATLWMGLYETAKKLSIKDEYQYLVAW
uniref:Mitochondrial carrier protein n=1 Tax=Acrobeloides nanus TaxID=290746 RepID=A0A914CK29_9BILA